MTSRHGTVTPEELHAYVDGFLDGDRRRAVEAYLAANPEEADMVAAYRRQNELLRAALRDDGVRTGLTAPRERRRERQLSGLSPGLSAAAGILLFLAGGLSGWLLNQELGEAPASPSFSRVAADAHRLYTVEKRHPVEVAANEAAHLRVWLSNRLGVSVWVPDLSDFGYDFVGGRLLPAAGRPAAQLMYQDGGGRRITCYLVPELYEGGARFVEDEGIGVLVWPAGRLTYAILGDSDRAELEMLARAVDSQRGEARDG